jgi:hypothetical protein
MTSDFVEVQLSTTGVKFAGAGATMKIATAHFSYTFTATTPTRVLTSEWRRVLSLKTYRGAAILEVVSESEATVETAASIAASSKRTATVGASHTDAPEQSAPKTKSEVNQ